MKGYILARLQKIHCNVCCLVMLKSDTFDRMVRLVSKATFKKDFQSSPIVKRTFRAFYREQESECCGWFWAGKTRKMAFFGKSTFSLFKQGCQQVQTCLEAFWKVWKFRAWLAKIPSKKPRPRTEFRVPKKTLYSKTAQFRGAGRSYDRVPSSEFRVPTGPRTEFRLNLCNKIPQISKVFLYNKKGSISPIFTLTPF